MAEFDYEVKWKKDQSPSAGRVTVSEVDERIFFTDSQTLAKKGFDRETDRKRTLSSGLAKLLIGQTAHPS
ncbi:MAG: hypothetical protein ACLR78_07135 [Roseburia sp.]